MRPAHLCPGPGRGTSDHVTRPAPLLLLHGFACLPQMFDAIASPLRAEGVATEQLLLPGHGPAPQMPTTTDFMTIAAQLADGVAAPRYHLAGYSLGGRVALAMALARPQRCASLTMLSAATGIADEKERGMRAAWDEQQAAALMEQGVAGFMQAWAELPLFATQARLPAAVREQIRTQRLAHTPEGLAWVMRVLGQGNMPALGARFGELRVPVRLLTGELDIRYGQMAAQLTQQHSAIKHHIIAEVGHNLVAEAPQQVLAPLRAVLHNPNC